MVNLENAMRGGNFDGRQLSLLPLPGMRTFDALALLVAGVLDPRRPSANPRDPGSARGSGPPGNFP